MKYRVSFLMAPPEVEAAIYTLPDTPAAKAWRSAGFAMGKSADKFASDISRAAANGLYERVVNLDAADLEDVFRLCNSIDSYWGDALPESANAVFLKKGKLRSMSVGDIVDDGAGNYWAVASFGFIPVSL